MDKNNPLYQKDYPEYKKLLWGMLRAFVTSFIPVFGFMLMGVTATDFANTENFIKLMVSLGLAGLVAGLVGVGKFLRDLYPESPVMAKLPI